MVEQCVFGLVTVEKNVDEEEADENDITDVEVQKPQCHNSKLEATDCTMRTIYNCVLNEGSNLKLPDGYQLGKAPEEGRCVHVRNVVRITTKTRTLV